MDRVDATNELIDRHSAAAMILRYGSSLDERDWERLSTCFTSDVISVLAGIPGMTSYRELEEAVRFTLGNYAATQHQIAGVEVEIDGDNAALRANLLATHTTDGPPFVVGGVYRERMVRTDEGWRITHHNLDALWMEGT